MVSTKATCALIGFACSRRALAHTDPVIFQTTLHRRAPGDSDSGVCSQPLAQSIPAEIGSVTELEARNARWSFMRAASSESPILNCRWSLVNPRDLTIRHAIHLGAPGVRETLETCLLDPMVNFNRRKPVQSKGLRWRRGKRLQFRPAPKLPSRPKSNSVVTNAIIYRHQNHDRVAVTTTSTSPCDDCRNPVNA